MKKYAKKFVAAFLFAAALPALGRAAWGPVSDANDFGNYPINDSAMVLDSAGRPHVVFVPDMSGPPVYNVPILYGKGDTADSSPAWSSQVYVAIYNSYHQIHDLSLAITPGGVLSISYRRYDGSNTDLVYQTSADGTVWSAPLVLDAGASSLGGGSPMALNAAGNPFISYYGANKSLKLARFDGVSWSTTTVDAGSADVGTVSSLVLDNGNPRIAYFDTANKQLKYVTGTATGNTWTIQTVDTSAQVFAGSLSLKLDSSANPRIAYYENSAGVKYAAWDGVSSWNNQAVSSLGSCFNPLLALDASNRPGIACGKGGTPNKLLYAKLSGGTWYSETVATNVANFYPLDLEMDAIGVGHPHVLMTGFFPVFQYSVSKGPAVPLNFAGVATSSTAIHWSWTDNSPDETSYILADSGGNPVKTLPSDASSWDQTGLAPNTLSQLKVRASNADGTGDSSLLPVYTLAVPPTGISVGSVFSSSITLSWTGAPGTIFQLEQGSGASPSSFSMISSGTATSGTATGLYSQTVYTFRVRGVNAQGVLTSTSTAPTVTAAQTTAGPPLAPGTPVVYNPFGNSPYITTTTIRWVWPDNSNNETGFNLRNADDPNPATNLICQTPDPVGTPCVQTGLSPNTPHRVVVEAVNGFGTTASPVSAYAYTGIKAPTGLSVQVFASSATFSWGNPDNVSTTYTFAATGPFPGFTLVSGNVSVSTTIAATSAITPNTLYGFYVYAHNGDSTDSKSSNVTATSPNFPVAPSSLSYNARDAGSITWTWQDNANNETGYRVYNATSGAVFANGVLAANAVSYVQSLPPNTSSQIMVQSFNGSGVALSPVSSPVFYTLAAVPSGVSASNVAITSMTISWTGNNPAGTVYVAESSQDNSSFTQFYSGTAPSAPVTGLAAQTTYYFHVRAQNVESVPTNYSASASAMTLPYPNAAPAVGAGADLTVTLPGSAALNGSVTDDGYPNGTLTHAWSKLSGPGTVTFGNASSLNSSASFSVSGVYVLRLTGNDGSLSTTDDVQVTVNPAGTPNTPPVANAGPDQTIALPASAALSGSASTDDGIPSPLTYLWVKVSGPGTVVFTAATSVNTSATFSVAGTYTLRLTASDGSLSNADTVVVTVNATVSGSGGGSGSIGLEAMGYPCPWGPGAGTPMTLANLPASGTLTVYTAMGRQVRQLTSDAGGFSSWDGKNDSGEVVASGAYLVIAKGPSGTKKFKVAVQK